MAHGKNTMVREEITVSDGLQLGHTTVDQTDVNTVEGEVDKLKLQNEKVCHGGTARLYTVIWKAKVEHTESVALTSCVLHMQFQ